MNIFYYIKRPLVLIFRFRHSLGNGVHSPSAFDFITNVVYAKSPSYDYKELERECKNQFQYKSKDWNHEPQRVNRLLFRLVNRVQPSVVIDAGIKSASSLYLQAAKSDIDYSYVSEFSQLFLKSSSSVDFLYLHNSKEPAFIEAVFQTCVPLTTSRSLFVVEGIHSFRSMRLLWKKLQSDDRTGVSFDLYDVGILFFDHSKIKQHYIVNF
ncbi:MAG: hypothetical protein M0P00_00165 [Bacteroidaceae bacterium]|nr:hypothetical protein [Bacteroidaceae bacterium]